MKTAVVLFNLGGPDKQESVKPFLFNLFNDPNIFRLPNPFRYLLARFISSRRTKEATEIYAEIGGKSPILEITNAQAEALQKKVKKQRHREQGICLYEILASNDSRGSFKSQRL